MKPMTLLASTCALTALATSALAAEPPKMDQASSMSYALGYQVGRDLAGTEVRDDALLQGLKDGQAGAAARLSPEEMEAALTALAPATSAFRMSSRLPTPSTAMSGTGMDWLASRINASSTPSIMPS